MAAGWLVSPALFLLFWRNRTAVTCLAVAFIALGLGMARGGAYARELSGYQPFYGQKVFVSARASEDGFYGKHSQMSFNADHISINGVRLPGKISVSGFGLNAIYQGDEVLAAGKLYPGYGSTQGSISYAHLELVAHHPSFIADIRRRFAAGMQSALPEPLASFAMGLLIGQRATLPDDVKQALLMVGLTHIIAVSGYNLTIILQASRGVFGSWSKRLSLLFSAALIIVFLLLAGSSASIVRAAIVSMLSLTAAYYGRTFSPANLLLMVAAITAAAHPAYVWNDASWYLSFLAFCGVMILAPALTERLFPGRELRLAAAVAIESMCAEIMTLPYVLHTFGQMSFIGLPANVLVTTLVPLAMLLSAVAGICGMLAAPFAGWLAWPARLLLTYMLDIARVLSGLPHVFVQNIGFSTLQMLVAYACVLAAGLILRFKTKPKNGTITDRKELKETYVRTLEMVND